MKWSAEQCRLEDPDTTHIRRHGKELDKDQKKNLRTKFVKGADIVPNTARLWIMILYLQVVDADLCPTKSVFDSLASDSGEEFSVALTNPPLG